MTAGSRSVYARYGVVNSAGHVNGKPPILSPTEFFEDVLPRAFEGEPGETEADDDIRLHYHLTGPGGGDWLVTIAGGEMKVERRAAPALVRYTLSSHDATDAINGLAGASPLLIVPRPPERSHGRSGAIRALRGTLLVRLERENAAPFSVEICFNGAERPHTRLEMTLPDYLAMQERRLVAQEAFAMGKMRVDGDMPFLMQVGVATST